MAETPREPNGRLHASKQRPATYQLYHQLRLDSWKMMVLMNVGGLLLLFLFGWIFMGAAAAINPQFFTLQLWFFANLISLPAFLLTLLTVIIVHELCHALFFFLFSGERPFIGFNLFYAYAAAPGWYFPRNQFILIGAAPVLLMTTAGLIWLTAAPFATVPVIILGMTVNAAGAIGDMLVILWLLAQPADTLVLDEGPCIILFKKDGE